MRTHTPINEPPPSLMTQGVSASPDVRAALEFERGGDARRAELAYRQVLAREPRDAAAQHLLGLLCFRTGRRDEALLLLRRSLDAAPGNVDFRGNYAGVLGALGRLAEAADVLAEALQRAPNNARMHNNLGVTLERAGRYAQAADAFARAAALEPENAAFRTHLGNALRRAGQAADAEAAYRAVLTADPSHAPARQNLSVVLQDAARQTEAVDVLRAAVASRPADAALHSGLLYAIHYCPGWSPRSIYREHLAWAARHEAPLAATGAAAARPHANDRDPDRRLRVGYVSPDLRRHSVATFFEPLLAHHDRDAVEVTCYSAADRPDELTARLRGRADRWRDVARATDDRVAELVRSDGIDVLVDLTGHMHGNRLGVFARRPAPVQVTYVGHPNTTGMACMGYRLTDPYLDPVGGDGDDRHTERLVRLPRVFGCYQPPEEAVGVAPAPLAASGGRVTFGCLNNPAKVTAPVLELWARLLAAVPGSTLVLLGQSHAAAASAMRSAGVDPARVRWLGRLRRTDYLRAFDQVDVALDPFPYNGQTTTCDGFWAGVPAVALAGDAYVSRMGGCLLRQVGLDDLVAATPDEYVATAARLAADTDRLVALRRTLRERLLDSPVVRAQPLAADVEAAYRGMWGAWCGGGQ